MNQITLDRLPLNHTGKVCELLCSGDNRRRILDLGICPNTYITNVFSSPFCDPIAYEIRKTVIALRKEDSRRIIVEE